MPTLRQAATAATAILTAKREPPEVINARLEICSKCEYAKTNASGFRWCGICGCLVDKRKGITNLASYEERLPHWGCKHPQRDEGFGWPKKLAAQPLAESTPASETPAEQE